MELRVRTVVHNTSEKSPVMSDMGLRWTFGQPRFVQPQLVRSSDWLVEPSFFPLSDKGTAGKGECLCCVDKNVDKNCKIVTHLFKNKKHTK